MSRCFAGHVCTTFRTGAGEHPSLSKIAMRCRKGSRDSSTRFLIVLLVLGGYPQSFAGWADWVRLFPNAAAARLRGAAGPDELAGRTFLDATPVENQVLAREFMWRLQRWGRSTAALDVAVAGLAGN